MHFKANERFEPNVSPEEFHKKLIRGFGNRDLLAQDIEPGSWIHAIETKAIAEWCCRTAAQVVVDFVSKAPHGVCGAHSWKAYIDTSFLTPRSVLSLQTTSISPYDS